MSRKFSRRNYVDALKLITPQIYNDDDDAGLTLHESVPHRILEIDSRVILRFQEISKYLRLFAQGTGPDPTLDWSSLNLGPWNNTDWTDRAAYHYNPDLPDEQGYAEGLVKYFIPQNNLTHITPDDFVLEIMEPLNYKMEDYSTSSAFYNFFKDTLYPRLSMAAGHVITSDATDAPFTWATIKDNTDGAFGDDDLETYRFLLNSLGLFQIINFQNNSVFNGTQHPYWIAIKEAVASIFTKRIYVENKPVTLEDAINTIREFVFNITGNYNNSSTLMYPMFANDIVDPLFAYDEDQLYLSGTQPLEKAAVWDSVLYGLTGEEQDDTFVLDFYESFFIDKNIPSQKVKVGLLEKFQTALGFIVADIDNKVLRIESLNSIERCPKQFLPYLSEMVGWKLYGTNESSWRRQLRESRSLLQKKGTKLGLQNLLSVILPTAELDFDEKFHEYNESYLPNLIYYILKTESPLLRREVNWTQQLANEFADGEYDPSDVDISIRFVVDHILLEAQERFPILFRYNGIAFAPEDPNFVFNYRGRNFNMPPWEFEEFYKDCDITQDLVRFIKEKLLCLNVSETIADAFATYVEDNTFKNWIDTELYNNGFVFLTKKLNLAPNYSDIIDNYKEPYFDLLPLWNGKSSQFTLTVSSGDFDTRFFLAGEFTSEDFFASLEAITDFVPAKADERIDIEINDSDHLFTFDKIFPRHKWGQVDYAERGTILAGASDVKDLPLNSNANKLNGNIINPSYDFDGANTVNNHKFQAVFKRGQTYFKRLTTNGPAYNESGAVSPLVVDGTYSNVSEEISNPNNLIPDRTSIRRRNFEKVLSKGSLFTRTGFNGPTFYNRTNKGIGSFEHSVLGLNPMTKEFEAVPDHNNLPAVWDACETASESSTNVFNGVKTANTFKVRGFNEGFRVVRTSDFSNTPIEARYRDELEEIYDFIYRLVDRKIELRAIASYNHNSHIFLDPTIDHLQSLKNSIWNGYDLSFESDFEDNEYDVYSRVPNEFNKPLSYLYNNDYVMPGRTSVSRSALEDVKNGGRSLVSHVYGPIFYNASLQIDGESLGIYPPSNPVNFKTTVVDEESEFSTLFAAPSQDKSSDRFLLLEDDRTASGFLEGIELVDNRPPNTPPQLFKNKISLYNIDDDADYLTEDSAVLGKNVVNLKAIEYCPRFRFVFDRDPDQVGNYLAPEHLHSLEISSLFLNDNDYNAGGRGYYVWIHTAREELDGSDDAVFWNLMPDGTWKMFDYNEQFIDSGDRVSYTKENYAFSFYHNPKEISSLQEKCSLPVERKPALYAATDNDFEVDKIEFDTLNRTITVPARYYKYHQQVHRLDQKYVVEVFPELDDDASKFWSFKGIRCVDETMAIRATTRFKFEIEDYSVTKEDTQNQFDLFYPDGKSVPLGSEIYASGNGALFEGEVRLTAALREATGKYKLFKTLNILINLGDDVNENYVTFEGYLTFGEKSLLGLVSTVDQVSVNPLFLNENEVRDPNLENGLGFNTDKWCRETTKRGGTIYTTLDFNDPSQPLRGVPEIGTKTVDSSNFWSDNVTILSSTNTAPYAIHHQNMLDSRISPYVGGKEVYDAGLISADPTDDNVYHDNKLNPYAYVVDFRDVNDRIDEGTLSIPKFPAWGDGGDYTGIPDGDHRWVLTTLVIDRTKNLEDIKRCEHVALCLGVGGYSPDHAASTFFRNIHNLTDGTNYLGMGSTGYVDDNSFFTFNGPTEWTESVYLKSDPKNIQYGSFDLDNYTVVYLAVNYNRIMHPEGVYLSGMDPVSGEVKTNFVSPSLVANIRPWRNSVVVPSIVLMGDYYDADKTRAVAVANCSLSILYRPAEYLFNSQTFIEDGDFKRVLIEGLDSGNFITSSVEVDYKLNPEELSKLFRFYNALGDQDLSRGSVDANKERVTNLESKFGYKGGGRSNYRINPLAFETTSGGVSNEQCINITVRN